MFVSGIVRSMKVSPRLTILAAVAAVTAVALPLSLAASSSHASTYLGTQGLSPAKAKMVVQAVNTAHNEFTACQKSAACRNSPPTTLAPVPGADLPFPTGIQSTKQAPMSPMFFTVSNQWETIYQGTEYSVYCGSTDSGVPAVVVWKNVISGATVDPQQVGQYTLPSAGSGVLTASSYSGAILTLTTPDGAPATFNLATLTLN